MSDPGQRFVERDEAETPLWMIFGAGFVIGIAAVIVTMVCFIPKHRNPVSLVKTYDQPREMEAGSFAIDNGLYDAIKKCSEANGTTAIEGTYEAHITCYAHDYVYLYMDWKWVPYGI